jgi:superoxide reductase
MKEQNAIYKCEICGNIVEVLHAGGGDAICCGQKMDLVVENSVEASLEKHVPVIEEVDGGIKVKIGSVPHPMEEMHHIEWVEILTKSEVWRHNFEVGDAPEVFFPIEETKVSARAYCNLHGLWKSAK